MEYLHCSRNTAATTLFSLLLLTSLGTCAILTQHDLSMTGVVGVAPTLITPAPAVDYQAIFARDAVATCGYVSGKAASPLTCPPSYMCTSTAFYSPGWGCCDQIQCQGNYYICQDFGGNVCMNLGDETCSKIYTSILKCSSAAPSCVTYARSRSVGDLSTEYSLGCGKASGIILALVSPVGGQGDNAASTSAPGGTSPLASSTDVAQPTDVIGSSPSSDSAQPTSNPSNTDSSKNSSNNNNNLSAGEIAGIVVPVVAMIVAVVVGWWKRHQVVWCLTCRRHGDKHSKRSARTDGSDYKLVNTPNSVPPPYSNHQGFPAYNQPHPPYQPQSFQASNPSISTQQTFHTGRPTPQPVYRVYDGN